MNFYLREEFAHLKDIAHGDNDTLKQFFRDKGLLALSVDCTECGVTMRETNKGNVLDGFVWKCYNKDCTKYKTTLRSRTNSNLANFNLSYKQVLLLSLAWFMESSVEQAIAEANVSKPTAIKFYDYLRSKSCAYWQDCDKRLGGDNIIVQIDESLFSHKPKYHRGRAPEREMWVFGLVDTSVYPSKGYMTLVPDRKASTLLPIIREVCKPGTIVHSDEWRAYSRIHDELGFEHYTVNHSLTFINHNNGVHTQAIESYWNKQKRRIKKMNGVRRDKLKDYIKEWMFRDNILKRDLQILLNLLK